MTNTAETEYAGARKIAQEIILAQVAPTDPGCANLSISGLENAITEALSTLLASEERLKEAARLAIEFWYSDHPNDTVEGHATLEKIKAALGGEPS